MPYVRQNMATISGRAEVNRPSSNESSGALDNCWLVMPAITMVQSRKIWSTGTSARNSPFSCRSMNALCEDTKNSTAGAYASGEQDRKGKLAPGYLADFVVLGADPLATPGDEIAAIPVRATYVGGRCVWPN